MIAPKTTLREVLPPLDIIPSTSNGASDGVGGSDESQPEVRAITLKQMSVVDSPQSEALATSAPHGGIVSDSGGGAFQPQQQNCQHSVLRNSATAAAAGANGEGGTGAFPYDP